MSDHDRDIAHIQNSAQQLRDTLYYETAEGADLREELIKAAMLIKELASEVKMLRKEHEVSQARITTLEVTVENMRETQRFPEREKKTKKAK